MARVRLVLASMLLLLACGDCELVADFDRARIPEPAAAGDDGGPDAALPLDWGFVLPDGGAGAGDDDAGGAAGGDEDAGS